MDQTNQPKCVEKIKVETDGITATHTEFTNTPPQLPKQMPCIKASSKEASISRAFAAAAAEQN